MGVQSGLQYLKWRTQSLPSCPVHFWRALSSKGLCTHPLFQLKSVFMVSTLYLWFLPPLPLGDPSPWQPSEYWVLPILLLSTYILFLWLFLMCHGFMSPCQPSWMYLLWMYHIFWFISLLKCAICSQTQSIECGTFPSIMWHLDGFLSLWQIAFLDMSPDHSFTPVLLEGLHWSLAMKTFRLTFRKQFNNGSE